MAKNEQRVRRLNEAERASDPNAAESAPAEMDNDVGEALSSRRRVQDQERDENRNTPLSWTPIATRPAADADQTEPDAREPLALRRKVREQETDEDLNAPLPWSPIAPRPASESKGKLIYG